MPALNQFLSARELAAADANGKPPAHIETHVTVAELDWKGDLRDVRFYLLTPDSIEGPGSCIRGQTETPEWDQDKCFAAEAPPSWSSKKGCLL